MEKGEPSERRVVHGKVHENPRGSHSERERAKLESAKEVVFRRCLGAER
jgi:hypothetical protein